MRLPTALTALALLLVLLLTAGAHSGASAMRELQPRDIKEMETSLAKSAALLAKSATLLEKIEAHLDQGAFSVTLTENSFGFKRMVDLGESLGDLEKHLESIDTRLAGSLDAPQAKAPERTILAMRLDPNNTAGTIEGPGRATVHSIICKGGEVRVTDRTGTWLGNYDAGESSSQFDLGVTVELPLRLSRATSLVEVTVVYTVLE